MQIKDILLCSSCLLIFLFGRICSCQSLSDAIVCQNASTDLLFCFCFLHFDLSKHHFDHFAKRYLNGDSHDGSKEKTNDEQSHIDHKLVYN